MQVATRNNPKHRQVQWRSTHVATTLYDVIEAVSEQVPFDKQYLLAPTVLKLLKDCGAGFLFNVPASIFKKPCGGSKNFAVAV